jgi:HSP20 family protein
MFNLFYDAVDTVVLSGINAWWEKDDLVVEVDLPGYAKGSISVIRDGDQLSIEAKKDTPERKYIFNNTRFPEKFRRTILLPEGLDSEKTDASYENGILRIQMQKDERKRTKNILVR